MEININNNNNNNNNNIETNNYYGQTYTYSYSTSSSSNNDNNDDNINNNNININTDIEKKELIEANHRNTNKQTLHPSHEHNAPKIKKINEKYVEISKNQKGHTPHNQKKKTQQDKGLNSNENNTTSKKDEINDIKIDVLEKESNVDSAFIQAERKESHTLDTDHNDNVILVSFKIAGTNTAQVFFNLFTSIIKLGYVIFTLNTLIFGFAITVGILCLIDLFFPNGLFGLIDIAYTIIFGIIFNLIFGILGNVLLALLSIFGMIWDPFLDVIVAILYFISCNLLGCCGMDANPVCAFSTLWRAMLTFWDIIAPFVNAMLKIFLALVGEDDPVTYLRRLANVLLFAIPNWITCFLNLWPTSINLIEFVSCFIQNVSQFLSLIPVFGPPFKCIVEQPNLGAKIGCFFAEYFKMITVVMGKVVVMILCVVFTLGRAACNLF